MTDVKSGSQADAEAGQAMNEVLQAERDAAQAVADVVEVKLRPGGHGVLAPDPDRRRGYSRCYPVPASETLGPGERLAGRCDKPQRA